MAVTPSRSGYAIWYSGHGITPVPERESLGFVWSPPNWRFRHVIPHDTHHSQHQIGDHPYCECEPVWRQIAPHRFEALHFPKE